MRLGKQCTAKSKRTGKRCRSPAVTGYNVCRMHGAGTRKRVLEGKRKSPRLASIKAGVYLKPETKKEWLAMDPRYAFYYKQVQQNPQVANMDEAAVAIHAQLRSVIHRHFENEADRDQAIQAISYAIARVEQVRMASKDKGNEEILRMARTVAQVFREFVPPERIAEALARLRYILGSKPGVLPPLPTAAIEEAAGGRNGGPSKAP